MKQTDQEIKVMYRQAYITRAAWMMASNNEVKADLYKQLEELTRKLRILLEIRNELEK